MIDLVKLIYNINEDLTIESIEYGGTFPIKEIPDTPLFILMMNTILKELRMMNDKLEDLKIITGASKF
ncbi:hypothetical protein KKF61_08820 [Patescibacteria group bacterium]|nr:hypothetical protein [Patescibacteria group bacterium]